MNSSSKAKLALVALVLVVLVTIPTMAVYAETTDPITSGINSGIDAALAAGSGSTVLGLAISGIRFLGKRINDAGTANVTPFQFGMFIFTGAVGFVAGCILTVLHINPAVSGSVAVILTYFITQIAPAFKGFKWVWKSAPKKI